MILNLKDQLGNQLFSYASCKCICKDTNTDFKWFTNGTDIVNSYDVKFGNTLDGGAFPNIDLSERIDVITDREYDWVEPWPRNENFYESPYKFQSDTYIRGHFQSEKYFINYREDVLKWFSLSSVITEKAKEKIADIRNKYSDSFIVSLHCRCGNDYLMEGRLLSFSYYKKSIKYIKENVLPDGKKLVLLVFSDKPVNYKLFADKNDCIICSDGTLFEDFALMQMCDAHIISNSTFAWWGAWLDKKDGVTIRPSIYPIANNEYYPEDIYPDRWICIKAKKSLKNYKRFWIKIRRKLR